MDRTARRRWHRSFWVWLVVLPACASAAGCVNALFTAMYLIRGTNTPAEFTGLKDKRVAVVCRPTNALTQDHHLASLELPAKVARLLEINLGRKIQLVPQETVDEWSRENQWTDFAEIGAALKADMVVGIELEELSLHPRSSVVYQGTAHYTLGVYDVTQGGKRVFEKIRATTWPPNSTIPASSMTRPQFRGRFLDVLAEEIGRAFYDHDAHSNVAQDARTIQYQ